MRIGIGLPNAVPGVSGPLLVEWARCADRGPFSSVGVFDRLLYDSLDPLAALAAAASVTQRLTLAATVIAAPLHRTALLAKSALTIDALSGGRLVLGLATGARPDDYATSGATWGGRGRAFSEQLVALRDAFDDDRIGPLSRPRRAPPILVGGSSDEAFGRVGRYADGYVHGGGPPRAFARAADRARAAWSDMRRPGQPLLWAQGYYALGDEKVIGAGRAYLRHYYAFTGPFADRIADSMLTTPQEIVRLCQGYADVGCDEIVLFPTVPALDQVERLAEAIGTR